ncbi:MAG: Hpt domain-containing protein, partial [Lachnospiraceae bacterium]|nr:Hpt domain-containing protein [Lachnospiraceae bacterium]
MDVSQYLDIFIDETSEHIQSLSDSIMVLEKEPENADTINEIFRAAHSLKGMAGTMGFKRMQHLTHDMENVFQEVRNDTIKVNGNLIDILFDCLDAIEGYLDTIKSTSDEGTEDNEVLIKKLNDFLASGNGEDSSASSEAPSEESASKAADEAGGEEPAYKTLKLEEEEIAKLSEAVDSGLNLYGFTVHIQKDCLLKAARAFLVFKAIEDFGEILIYNPSSQDIEDEKFDFTFSFIASSDSEDLNAMNEAVGAVSEVEKVESSKVTPDMYKTVAEESSEGEGEAAAEASPSVPAASAAPAAPAASDSGAKKPAANSKTANKPVTSRTVRVDIEKLDDLMNQVSELIIAKNSIVSLSAVDSNGNSNAGMGNQTLHEQVEYLERITTSLHESVMKVRMVPIESTVNKFPRMIRDLSRKLGKPMDLVMTGEETEL